MAKGKDLNRGSAYEKNEQRNCHRNGFVTETAGIWKPFLKSNRKLLQISFTSVALQVHFKGTLTSF